VTDIVDRHLISRMRDAISALQGIAEEWTTLGTILEADWSRMRSLEFQETLRARNSVVKKLVDNTCVHCPSFPDHVSNFPITH